MKVTLRGGLTLAGCMIVPVTQFLCTEMWLILINYTVKYVFGEGAAATLYRASAAYHNFQQRVYFAWVGALLEFGLGTRVAYTIVDAEGQAHLEQHYLSSAGNDAQGRPEKSVMLNEFLSPPSKAGKAKIIIMNHHCRLDWLYMFIFFARTQLIVQHIRFVLKGDLRHIPVLGWVMEMFRYIFLSRSWENDEPYIQRMIKFYATITDTPVIFIFPEGTDLSPGNIERSQAFAAKSGLPKFHHVLNPRTTGLTAIVKMLGGTDTVEEILDFTIGYTYHAPGERPDEPSLINGHHPRKVHLLMRRYTVTATGVEANSAPTAEEALTAWTHARFAEKEQLLSRFLVSNPMGFDPADIRAVMGAKVGVAGYDEDEHRLHHPGEPAWRRYLSQAGLFGLVISPIYWMVPLLYLLCCTTWWRTAVWTVLVLVGFAKSIRAIGGIQRTLFLTEVPPEKTIMQRIRRYLQSRANGKEKKRE